MALFTPHRRPVNIARRRKAFDAVRFMHDAQVRINRETKGMTVAEQAAYFRTRAESGPLGEWWKTLETRSTARKTQRKAA